MKKAAFLIFLVVLTASSFAGDLPNRRIFIEGTADRTDHLDYFMENFKEEAVGTGYPVAKNREDAGYIFRFDVSSNMVEINGTRRQAPANDNQYVLKISLIRNEDNFEVLVFDFYFTDLDEMYLYNQGLFLRAASYIPPYREDDLVIIVPEDTRWKNQWVYFRASFDYPITFYLLQKDKLFAGKAVYAGNIGSPDRVSTPLEHKIIALPGVTLGFEFCFIDYMSLELNFQVNMGDPRNNYFYNLGTGAELKFPALKTTNFMVEPYCAAVYYMNKSPEFAEYPEFAFGGGLQIAAKGGKQGAFFVDAKFMFSFSNAVVYNSYGELYPNPPLINYKRLFLGLGIGYKVGLLDRDKTLSNLRTDF